MAEPSTVLITGAASGIGRALAHRYARTASTLLLLDREAPASTAEELAGARATVRTAGADVRDAEAVVAAVTALADGGTIDLVVNCAGILPPIDPVESVRPDDFKRTIDINLTGSFHVVQAALPHLRKGSGVGSSPRWVGSSPATGTPRTPRPSSASSAWRRRSAWSCASAASPST